MRTSRWLCSIRHFGCIIMLYFGFRLMMSEFSEAQLLQRAVSSIVGRMSFVWCSHAVRASRSFHKNCVRTIRHRHLYLISESDIMMMVIGGWCPLFGIDVGLFVSESMECECRCLWHTKLVPKCLRIMLLLLAFTNVHLSRINLFVHCLCLMLNLFAVSGVTKYFCGVHSVVKVFLGGARAAPLIWVRK